MRLAPHQTRHRARQPFTQYSKIALAAIALLSTFTLAGPLDSSTSRLISRTDLGGGTASVYIADLDTGEEIADYNGTVAMVPASNMKILTSGAALFVLGSDFTFRTELILDDTTTPPTLIIKGDGDPALGDPAIFMGEESGTTLDTLFDQIAGVLTGAGISKLSQIIIDDTVFDRTYTHPDWPIEQLNRWYCAHIGGLNFHTNVINCYPFPSPSGGAPSVKIQPDAHWVEMQVKAKSTKKKRDTAWIARPKRENSFTLLGNVSAQSEIAVAIDSPPEFAGHLLASELLKRDIQIGTEHASVDHLAKLIEPADLYTSSRTLAVITTPIDDVLNRTNTDSYNLYAEALIKRIGHEITSDPGSWENGATVIRTLLSEKIGAAAAEETVIADGSGMSRMNKVSPKTLSTWMRKLARSDHWSLFEDSLANPGVGTLRKRFLDDDALQSTLYAKSGYLTGMYSLSGVLEHPRSGQRVVFSIMLNNVKSGATSRNAKPMIDSIINDIDAWMSEKAGTPRKQPLGG